MKIKKSNTTPKTDTAPKAAKAKGTATEAKPEVRQGINIGRKTGMRVMAFQDHSFARNDDPKFRRTDEELAADWRAEFPESRAVKNGRITADMVRAVRILYNNGTNGHGTPGVKHESKPYTIVSGKRVKGEYAARERKAAEPKADAKAAPVKVKKVKTATADKTAAA